MHNLVLLRSPAAVREDNAVPVLARSGVGRRPAMGYQEALR